MEGVKDTTAFAAYKELLKHNHIMHTIDLRLRCSNEELKLIGDHVFRNLRLVDPLKAVAQKKLNTIRKEG
jgi:hypothetical protein